MLFASIQASSLAGFIPPGLDRETARELSIAGNATPLTRVVPKSLGAPAYLTRLFDIFALPGAHIETLHVIFLFVGQNRVALQP